MALSIDVHYILSVIRNQSLQSFELNRNSVHARFMDLVGRQNPLSGK
ncbi:MAG: hypothetical protein SPL41_09655 [Succinivibrionaceae bacterium]|nr:hypothetical protein [Succinivibrionaceae bacterium]MDY6376523.1 hypothetical protein [Succinivibrionaceae bacterium]